MKKRIEYSDEQVDFLEMPHKFRAFVGGYRSGKTVSGATARIKHAADHPGVNMGYFAPTYPQIRDIFYPKIEEVAFWFGKKVMVNQGNKEVHVYQGKRYLATIICRSMQDPGSIIGFEIGDAMVDELDTLNRKKALEAWEKIIARLSCNKPGVLNRVDVTTTPEGYAATHHLFVEKPEDNKDLKHLYGIVHSSTRSNAHNLPDDYISSLMATYPDALALAYIEGQFCNLTKGSVYTGYNKDLNDTDIEPVAGETLYVGMDFNVGNMSAIVHVLRDGLPIAVREICELIDTPAMIKTIRNIYPHNKIYVFPDSSGGNRDTRNASVSDISLLEDAKFIVDAPAGHPPVRDRVMAMNAMFLNAEGNRRYKVNYKMCPKYGNDLSQQAYDDKGAPDKTQGQDHRPDAAGYFIHRRFPVKRPLTVI